MPHDLQKISTGATASLSKVRTAAMCLLAYPAFLFKGSMNWLSSCRCKDVMISDSYLELFCFSGFFPLAQDEPSCVRNFGLFFAVVV